MFVKDHNCKFLFPETVDHVIARQWCRSASWFRKRTETYTLKCVISASSSNGINTKNKNENRLTWTLLSGRLIFMATSSLINMSGYFVLVKSSSKISSCALVKVVRSLRCFLGWAVFEEKWNVSCFDRRTPRGYTTNSVAQMWFWE